MAKATAHEALIFLMVVTSAVDTDMTDEELTAIGAVVRGWRVFEDFNPDRLVKVAQKCQKRLAEQGGLDALLAEVREALPTHLHDTAYAAAFEVASADLEMRMEEKHVLDRIRNVLDIDATTIAAIERATKARCRSLT
jgi:tellurite resistance protein